MSYVSKSSWECISSDGERIPNGQNYVPGPDNCTACKCEKGEAKFCRAALCQPPQYCNSFRVGESCCDFICLDDILPTKPNGTLGPSDAGLRMVASAITAILSVALFFFLIHRLRQRKLRTAQHQYFEEHFDGSPDTCRNNACCHNALYLSGNDHVDFFLDGYTPPYSPWKPPSYSFTPREPPPPYSEVGMATALPSLNPLMMELTSTRPLSQTPHRNSIRNSVIGAEVSPSTVSTNLQQEGAVALEPPVNSTILSDQVYANSFIQSSMTSPKLCSAVESNRTFNDLNRGDDVSPTDSPKGCQCSFNKENCNVCLANTKDMTKSKTVRNRDEEEPEDIVENFRLRLQLDISDSSNSTPTNNPLSLGSESSRSSEDAPSFVSGTETQC